MEDWIERAELESPELRSLGAQVEAARHTSIKTRYSNKFIGLLLNIPLYSGGHVSSPVRQAVAGQQRAAEALEALRRDLGVRLHREFRGVTEGTLRAKALEQAVRSAEQVVLSNRRSFEAGSRTLPDVLNAEQQKVSAQRDLAQARFVYLVSRIRLQALSGGAKTEVIEEINGWLAR
ncbi:outer membrane protein TolC [Variovorax sp. SG517]|uniref:TolC family protein n=1 Tax=Variovorax sp. SG517 TaxID=2587117 RepID=UPI00179615B2|nr:outer membrane protein TolC [Variovorax sp. SG517]